MQAGLQTICFRKAFDGTKTLNACPMCLVAVAHLSVYSNRSMILFCVRVSCGEDILYGPKWIGVETDRTVRDLLRCATGDRFIKQRVKVLVAGEDSLKELSIVRLEVPVTILDQADKKIVCFVLQQDKEIVVPITVSSYMYFV